jgi:hypothetical protein
MKGFVLFAVLLGSCTAMASDMCSGYGNGAVYADYAGADSLLQGQSLCRAPLGSGDCTRLGGSYSSQGCFLPLKPGAASITPPPSTNPPPSKPTGQGHLRWTFTNGTKSRVVIKWFSKTRDWTWPGPRYWEIDDKGVPHSYEMDCQIGEQICYGANYMNGSGDPIRGTYWGVSAMGSEGCKGCCLTCSDASENVHHEWPPFTDSNER